MPDPGADFLVENSLKRLHKSCGWHTLEDSNRYNSASLHTGLLIDIKIKNDYHSRSNKTT